MAEFFKLSGAGNDFIVVDNRTQLWEKYDIQKLCVFSSKRGTGVGADGMILIENSKKARIKTRIMNSDGSEADFCGNGLRCAARFAFLKVIAGKKMTIETKVGVVDAEVLQDKNVSLRFQMAFQNPLLKEVSVSGKVIKGYYVVAGVPHFILFVNDIDKAPVSTLGSQLRSNAQLPEGGANITFLKFEDSNFHQYRTYERGVEGETLACGSAAVAAGFLLKKVFGKKPPFSFKARSGKILEVDFPKEKGQFLDCLLLGEASFIYKGQFSDEYLSEFLK
ncbi:MAG: diaminopimelate epimerase [Acidobacteriota bacterium]